MGYRQRVRLVLNFSTFSMSFCVVFFFFFLSFLLFLLHAVCSSPLDELPCDGIPCGVRCLENSALSKRLYR